MPQACFRLPETSPIEEPRRDDRSNARIVNLQGRIRAVLGHREGHE